MSDRIEKNNNDKLMEEIRICNETLLDRKADDVTVLYLGPISTITDYFIIATANSEPHLKALSGAVAMELKKHKIEVLSVSGSPDSGWVVVDAFDFVVHLLHAEKRSHYRLESLWKDAQVVDLKASGNNKSSKK